MDYLGEAWYVLQTKPRQEFRAKDNLERQGFRCLLPLLQVEKLRHGRRVWTSEPLFTRYLFIELRRDNQKWGVIRSTRGVARLVEFGGVLPNVQPRWIEAFQRQDTPRLSLFEPGQRLVVTQGPFAGLDAVYQMADGEARAVVLLELLGKPCKASLPFEALKRAA